MQKFPPILILFTNTHNSTKSSTRHKIEENLKKKRGKNHMDILFFFFFWVKEDICIKTKSVYCFPVHMFNPYIWELPQEEPAISKQGFKR